MTFLEQSEGSRFLQFTLEKTNSEGNLPFQDLNINVSQGRRVICSWYQKPAPLFSMPQNSLHPILQFTLEKTNSEGNLPFQDLKINVSQGRRVICSWYQKPTDTGTILNYRSCAPTQYKRSVIQGTVHRVFMSTSSLEQFDKAMETNRVQWLTIIP